jgi:hypothetical protein
MTFFSAPIPVRDTIGKTPIVFRPDQNLGEINLSIGGNTTLLKQEPNPIKSQNRRWGRPKAAVWSN